MQQKLKELYAPSDLIRMQAQTANRLNSMGMSGVNGPGRPDQERSAMQYRRNLEGYIREEYKKQEELVKLLGKRDAILKDLKDKQKDILKGSKEELEVKEKIARIEENQARKREEYKQRDGAINQAADAKRAGQMSWERVGTAYQNGGLAGAGRAGMRMGAQAFRENPWGMIGGIAGAVGSAVGIGGQLYQNYTQSPIRTAGNLGSGVGNTVGQDSNIIAGGRSAFEAAFNPERARAAQMALEASRGNRVGAGTGIAGNILGFGAAGAAGGSIIPGFGTAAGAIGGGAYGAYRTFSDPTQRALALSPFSSRYGDEYESIMAERMGGDYQKSLAGLKAQNPGKTMASNYYESNYQGNLASQRSMGMSNEGFYGAGGFLQGGVNAGFTPQMMMQASGGILGAGGSTRSAIGNSVFANQLNRSDITNSSQILGSLSSSIGSSEGSRQATIKILAEGMKLGLDDSKFAEENRRFAAATAEIISRSGAQGGGDFERVAGGFSRFMTDNTNGGLAAGRTAYEQYQGISSSTSGPRGVMRAAGFMKDDKLSQLSTIDKQAIMQLPEEQLNESNPLVAGMAEKVGTTTQDFVQRIRNINQGAVSRFKQADQIRDRLRSRGIDVGRSGDKDYMSSISPQDRGDITSLMAYQTTELGNQGQKEMIARAAGTVGRSDITMGDLDGGVESKIGGSGRGEDLTISQTAKDFGVVIQNFRDFKKEIIPTAEAISQFTGKVREMMIALSTANDTDIPNIIKYYTQSRAKTQTQTSKPSR